MSHSSCTDGIQVKVPSFQKLTLFTSILNSPKKQYPFTCLIIWRCYWLPWYKMIMIHKFWHNQTRHFFSIITFCKLFYLLFDIAILSDYSLLLVVFVHFSKSKISLTNAIKLFVKILQWNQKCWIVMNNFPQQNRVIAFGTGQSWSIVGSCQI